MTTSWLWSYSPSTDEEETNAGSSDIMVATKDATGAQHQEQVQGQEEEQEAKDDTTGWTSSSSSFSSWADRVFLVTPENDPTNIVVDQFTTIAASISAADTRQIAKALSSADEILERTANDLSHHAKEWFTSVGVSSASLVSSIKKRNLLGISTNSSTTTAPAPSSTSTSTSSCSSSWITDAVRTTLSSVAAEFKEEEEAVVEQERNDDDDKDQTSYQNNHSNANSRNSVDNHDDIEEVLLVGEDVDHHRGSCDLVGHDDGTATMIQTGFDDEYDEMMMMDEIDLDPYINGDADSSHNINLNSHETTTRILQQEEAQSRRRTTTTESTTEQPPTSASSLWDQAWEY